MDVWSALVAALRELPSAALASPGRGRVGAALVLLGDPQGTGDLEVVYTRRRDDLPTHPGQISFPGGRVEPGESVEHAAVREAAEEVALDPASVEVLGRLPAFYIPPSRFWLLPVVARWRAPHDLVAAEAEVADVVRARLSTLRDPAVWRVVWLPALGHSWAWQLDHRHLLWGATAVVTSTLLGLVDPHWHGGARPQDLPADRELRPWDTAATAAPRPGRALLTGLAERSLEDVAAPGGDREPPRPSAPEVEAAGTAVAAAVARLAASRSAAVVVLAGAGGNGAAGLSAARRLLDAGADVRVVLDRPAQRLRGVAAEAVTAVREVAGVFGGALPAAEVVVDALVGGGLVGPLRGAALAVTLALRHHGAPTLAVDLPSGVHPVEGLIGECVPADVTVALRAPRPGLLHPGLGPYVGDLYLAGTAGEPLVRIVPGAPVGGGVDA